MNINYDYPLNVINDIYSKKIFERINIVALLIEIEKLGERKANIIRFRYRDKKTLQECGEILNLTRERIRQIQNKAIRQLRHPTRIKLYKVNFKTKIINWEKMYYEWSNKNPNFLVVLKEGQYYTARDESAKVLHYISNYEIGSNGRNVITGSLNLEPILKALNSNKINYIIVQNNEIRDKKEFGSCYFEFKRYDKNKVNENANQNNINGFETNEDLLVFINTLLNDVNPLTGEKLERNHILQYKQMKVILNIVKNSVIEKNNRENNSLNRVGDKWTLEEDEQLKQEYLKKLSVKKIAKKHGRSKGAIYSRLKKLDLRS